MVETLQIEKGSAVRLIDNTACPDIPVGTVGIANAVVNVDERYVWFMPSTKFEIFVLKEDKLELIPDDEAQAMGFEELTPELPEQKEIV
jgi:hypothetical protein